MLPQISRTSDNTCPIVICQQEFHPGIQSPDQGNTDIPVLSFGSTRTYIVFVGDNTFYSYFYILEEEATCSAGLLFF